MCMSFLQNLDAKSSATKGRYAFAFAAAITGAIAIVWISTIPARFAQVSPMGKQDPNGFVNDTKTQLGNVVDWNGDTELPPNDAAEAIPQEEPSSLSNLGNADACGCFGRPTSQCCKVSHDA